MKVTRTLLLLLTLSIGVSADHARLFSLAGYQNVPTNRAVSSTVPVGRAGAPRVAFRANYGNDSQSVAWSISSRNEGIESVRHASRTPQSSMGSGFEPSDHEVNHACATLLDSVGMSGYWTVAGPTDLARQTVACWRCGGITPVRRTLLRLAFTAWRRGFGGRVLLGVDDLFSLRGAELEAAFSFIRRMGGGT